MPAMRQSFVSSRANRYRTAKGLNFYGVDRHLAEGSSKRFSESKDAKESMEAEHKLVLAVREPEEVEAEEEADRSKHPIRTLAQMAPEELVFLLPSPKEGRNWSSPQSQDLVSWQGDICRPKRCSSQAFENDLQMLSSALSLAQRQWRL